MEVEWSPLSIQRVLELADYIALDKPDIASQSACNIFDSTEKLKEHPKLGRVVPEINDNDFRELIEGDYRVVYWLGTSKISILTVCHGKQLLPIDEVK